MHFNYNLYYSFTVPDTPGIEDFDIGDTWVNVSWTPSEEEQKNPGTYFYVEYKKPGKLSC